MKFILALCLLFFSAKSNCQITRATLDLLTSTMQLFVKGEYEKVIPLQEKAMTTVKMEVGENDPLYIGQLFLLGYCHYMLYQYPQAEKYYLQQKEKLEKTTGTNDVNYSACLARLGVLYRDMGKYQQSIDLYLQVKEINKVNFGVKSSEYSTALNNLAVLYGSVGHYAKAEQFYLESLSIVKITSGENSEMYAANCNNISTLYSEMGQYEKAEQFCIIGLNIRKAVLGESHPHYAESLNNLAALEVRKGKYDEAESIYKKANAIFKKSLGEASPVYASGLNNLADFYQTTGQYAKAESIFIEAKVIRKKILGENHSDYASTLNNLADLYLYAGQYEKAELLYLQAKEIKGKSLGENHIEYSISLNNLGLLYEYIGQYRKAESLYTESIAIKKKTFGESHPQYATALNNLATLYSTLGQYDKSEALLNKALLIIEKTLGQNNKDYATSLDNLANILQSQGQYAKAEAVYIKAMQTRKTIFGESNTFYAYSLNNLAAFYGQIGQYKKAEPLIVQAKEIWRKTMGENSAAYATAVNNLAAFYRLSQTQLTKAEALSLEAIRLRKLLLGDHHPDLSISQNNLALLYMQTGQYKKAEPLFVSSCNIVLQNITGNFGILSEKEKGKYLDYNREVIECSNSFMYNYKQAPPAVAEYNYNLELGFKSLALADTRNVLEKIRNSKDTTVARILDQWVALKNILAKQYSKNTSENNVKIKNLEAEAEAMEKELNRVSSLFSSQQKTIQVTSKNIQQKLGADEAAIEFVKFRLYTSKWTDSVIYGAYLLRKNDAAPQFIRLCEKKQLQQLFDSAGNTAPKLVKSFYRGLDVRSNEAKLGKRLYNLIWAPIEPFLGGIKKISYSPAGQLYSIAFNALPVDSTTILMDKYQLQQYTSTRQIFLRAENEEITRPGSIVLFGDAMFTMDSIQLVKQQKKSNNVSADISTIIAKSRGNENGVWNNLPGTAIEIENIGKLFNGNRASSLPGQSYSEVYSGETASEDNLKLLSGKQKQVIHIATHGFFLPEPKKKSSPNSSGNIYSLAEDPLLRTGLVFAGGNYAWSGRAPIEGIEDGIATAYEISQLNLSQTQLIVLSACETALGDIKGSEGVFGLQRAFKIAGVKKMIVSLWQVPDKETAELMINFYTYWMKGKTINESFYQAQSDMRKKYPAYYWAAFVLVE